MSTNSRSAFRTGITLAALGVVFGDIGTSPLYTLKTCLDIAHAKPTAENLVGILSLLIWALVIVVCVKYVTVVMRVDHDGEGGILALLSLLLPRPEHGVPPRPPWYLVVVVIGAAMLFGDGVITPAISVISAVEGIGVATSALQPWIVPVSVGLIVLLFAIQARGTEKVGGLFGPVMVLWFVSIGVAGALALREAPEILAAFDPRHALWFATHHGNDGFLVLGGVVLCVTGVEALYADLSHFGRKPITIAWYGIVLPATLLSYLGQGAHVLTNVKAIDNTFYAISSGWALWPMVVLATLATIIASQALISGAFTLTEQAIALNLCPRMEVLHTSNRYPGQVYVPAISAILGVACVILVLLFQSSDRLAAAYGLAVSFTMLATSIAFYLVVSRKRHWHPAASATALAGFVAIDGAFVAAGLHKFVEGGYVPVAISAVITLLALTWLAGRRRVGLSLAEQQESIEEFLRDAASAPGGEMHGTMVFLTGDPSGVPFLGKHRWLRVRAQYERVVLLTLIRAPGPYAEDEGRVSIEVVSDRLIRVFARFGFMEQPKIAPVIAACAAQGLDLEDPKTSFFYADPKIVAAERGGMPSFLREAFEFMVHVARPLTDDLEIPAERRVELGLEVRI